MYLEHVNLTVANLDRSIDFYSRLLDYRVRWEDRSGTVAAAHVGDDRFYLALFQASDGRTERPKIDYEAVGMNHFGIVVDDLDDMKRRLAALGTAPHSERDYHPGRRVYFLDPDGMEVELVEYKTPASS